MVKRRALSFLFLASAVYSLVYLDVLLRARTAYREGERYAGWRADPSLKKARDDARFSVQKDRLDRDKAAGRMGEMEYRQRLALAELERSEAAAESSLKYAHHWFRTAADLFSQPENRWARLSRRRMAETERLWRQELDEARIPYREPMLR